MQKDYLKDFAERLKTLRESQGLSYRDLDSATGISKSALEGYEKCRHAATLGHIAKLAEYFKVSASWLIGESDERTVYGEK